MSILAEFRAPWVYNDVTGHIATHPDKDRPHGAVVAHAGHHPGFIRQEVIGPLIAAGPEMLVALIEIDRWLISGFGDERRLRTAVQDAIAKAKGGAS
ncbi:hypothetical protein [Sphingobium yanoikuyae]|uniref:hypothetical protein n=1 Tax=Sphingobium yanoikuyae TaxID=13690 RepID=UPI0028A9348C|nr:hypothetical protein [Sphingobium yanoikuyae]